MDVKRIREIADGLAAQDNEVDQEIARELYEALDAKDYRYLEVKKGDRVRITVPPSDSYMLSYTAEGKVHSAYSNHVWNLEAGQGERRLIGYSPAGIELHDDTRGGKYGYWKAGDGGKVWKLVGEEWVQVFPIQYEGDV